MEEPERKQFVNNFLIYTNKLYFNPRFGDVEIKRLKQCVAFNLDSFHHPRDISSNYWQQCIVENETGLNDKSLYEGTEIANDLCWHTIHKRSLQSWCQSTVLRWQLLTLTRFMFIPTLFLAG